MREIDVKIVKETVKKLFLNANFYLDKKIKNKIKDSLKEETTPIAKDILKTILENAELAEVKMKPICQDTGSALVFMEIGQDVHFTNGFINDAVNDGMREAYLEGFLRKSIVQDPVFERVNTKDNSPAIIYQKIVPGDRLKIIVAPKGGGAENMGEVRMLKPADGLEGVKKFILERIKTASGNPCPPIIVGVGIGGNFDYSAYLAKKALLRSIDEFNENPKWAEFEKEMLIEINKLNVGPQGLGGKTTALKVSVETYPCHIASLPVAINLQCHAHRHAEIII
jgi:fumarate hydratase subunit alpha